MGVGVRVAMGPTSLCAVLCNRALDQRNDLGGGFRLT